MLKFDNKIYYHYRPIMSVCLGRPKEIAYWNLQSACSMEPAFPLYFIRYCFYCFLTQLLTPFPVQIFLMAQ